MTSNPLIIGATTCLLLCLSTPAFAQSKAWLNKGNISVKTYKVKGSDTPKVIVKAVVDSPPSKVWKVVSDCARYTKTMNRISESKLISKSGSTYICEVEIDLPFPLSNLRAKTRATHTVTPQKMTRSWNLIKGDFKVNTGSWVVEPFNESGTRSVVTYTVHAEPTTSVPDWVKKKARDSSMPKLIKRVRKEAKKVR